jgi:N-acetyltransferase
VNAGLDAVEFCIFNLMIIKPITLEGDHAKLEPLRFDHLPALIEIGLDESIWKWTANVVSGPGDIERYVREAMAAEGAGTALPFVTIAKESGKVVGSTRFANIDPQNRKVEIGWTWITPAWQRTAINTEAKLLMLRHAFETWECIRVELKTDANNEKSRSAIARIGAAEEGTLRNHMITESGRFRDSVIDSEWKAVEERLRSLLADR